SKITTGPAFEALLDACHLSAFAALRVCSSSCLAAADRQDRTKLIPKWPLVMVITSDAFVRRH
ncbi:unnamed protein product, partial [Effrenium voratum]